MVETIPLMQKWIREEVTKLVPLLGILGERSTWIIKARHEKINVFNFNPPYD